MGKSLAMFPGQGSQFVGMGRDLLVEFPACRHSFEEAEDAARINVRRLCFDGPEDELRLTANTQACILTVSIAIWRVLVAESGWTPQFYAGHSLGEYSALVAAGRLTLSRAAYLVRCRGQAMQDAVPPGLGAMAAVINVAEVELKAYCAAALKKVVPQKFEPIIEIVNYNSPGQLVVAGHKIAVDTLVTELEQHKIRAVTLPVSAPFHSSLMKPAQIIMQPLLRESDFADNNSQIIANVSGKLEINYNFDLLVRQIASPVLWTQTLQYAQNAECTDYIEIGPGKVLFGLARRSLPKSVNLHHSEDLPKLIETIKNQSSTNRAT